MIGGKYKNIALVTMILGGFVAFMIVTTAWVVHSVSKGRSCVRHCDDPAKAPTHEEVKTPTRKGE